MTISAGMLSTRGLPPNARVFRGLKQWIADGRLPNGERLPSENALAAEFGVARATLRVALKQLENEGLLRPQGKGRIVTANQTVRPSVMSQVVAMLVDAPGGLMPTTQRRAGWERNIQIGADDAIRNAGLHALTLQADLVASDHVHRLIAEPPRGVIALREALESPAGRNIIANFTAAGVPVVGYGHHPELANCDTVASDHAAGAYALTRWLLQRGRRRILRFWESSTQRKVRPAWIDQRDAGYERAMREAGLAPLPAVESPASPRPDHQGATFEHRMRHNIGYLVEHITGSECVDAIMLLSDGTVPTTAAACRMLGKIPNQDIDLVGYDNYWFEMRDRAIEPTAPLATVDKDNYAVGQALGELLVARAEGKLPPEPQHRLVEPRLIEVAEKINLSE